MLIKVCILTTVHYVFDIRIFHKEAKSLVRAGYDVTLIAQHDKSETIEGVKIIPLPKVKNRLLRMFGLTFITFLLSVKQRADIYHFHDPELLFTGLLLKIFMRGKVIYDVHEDYSKQIQSKTYLPAKAKKIIALLIRIVEYHSSRYFDAIITATDDILQKFSKHRRAQSIKNYPILSFFSKEVKASEDKTKRDGEFRLIYTGGLVEVRGITQIIKAMELINCSRNVKLLLCGKFYPSDYEQSVKGLKGIEKVKYHGWLKPKDMFALMETCDAGVICFLPEPNHLNAMPNKLFEYMAAGLPVIASHFQAWREIVEGNKCGICVDPLNPEAIASGIQYLMDHQEEAKAMGERGTRLVESKCNWANEERKLLETYMQLTAHH